MNKGKRLRRKDPARSEPLRNFHYVYREPAPSDGQPPSAGSVADGKTSTAKTAKNPLVDSVSLAYRVIERYLNDGRRAAQKINPQSYPNPVAGVPLQELVDRMLRFQAEMLPLLLDFFGSLGNANLAGASRPQSTGSGTVNNGSSARDRISLEIDSAHPVEVSLSLTGNTHLVALATPGLHALEPRSPALTNIKFIGENENSKAKLLIKIPVQQPAGVYSGVLVDRMTGDTQGTLTVRLASRHTTKGKLAR